MGIQDTINHSIADLKKASGKIVITTHFKPDGDAIGSSLGLYNYLKNCGIDSVVIAPSDYADFLDWIPGNDKVIVYEDSKELSNKLIAESQYVFCLDFNTLSRVGGLQDGISNSTAEVILIDHHQDPDKFDSQRFIEIGASSTCELVYHYIAQHLGVERVDNVVGECLYTGLITDTGSFRFGSTTSTTLKVAGNLVDLGVVPSKIYNNLFDNNRLIRLQLLGYFLSQKIEVIENGKVALASLTLSELEQFEVKTGDTEGFVNYGLSIDGVEMSALIIDRGPLVKMSFRSKHDFACNEFANAHFSGGGHRNAAGGASKIGLEKTLEKFKTVIKDYNL